METGKKRYFIHNTSDKKPKNPLGKALIRQIHCLEAPSDPCTRARHFQLQVPYSTSKSAKNDPPDPQKPRISTMYRTPQTKKGPRDPRNPAKTTLRGTLEPSKTGQNDPPQGGVPPETSSNSPARGGYPPLQTGENGTSGPQIPTTLDQNPREKGPLRGTPIKTNLSVSHSGKISQKPTSKPAKTRNRTDFNSDRYKNQKNRISGNKLNKIRPKNDPPWKNLLNRDTVINF